MDTFKLLQTLTETPGPSGNEKAIANVVREWWEPYTSRFISDHVGNLMAVKEGSGEAPRRTILLAAHMDEIALMVHQVVGHNGNGFYASPTLAAWIFAICTGRRWWCMAQTRISPACWAACLGRCCPKKSAASRLATKSW
ncbi:MAG: hypothetical protein IPJ90_11475 [Anaerolineaceae bacterium]|nr:hypothetical protein [Anaerolineaceae bacterium]